MEITALIIGLILFFGLIFFAITKLSLSDREDTRQREEAARIAADVEAARIAALSPQELEEEITAKQAKEAERLRTERDQLNTYEHGPVNLVMVCPHCTGKGQVHTRSVVLKKGVSGGKATAALLTGGVSLLATGLSRKEANTQAWCGNCSNQWIF